MDSSIIPLIVGGTISLVSALAVIILQHKLSMQKMVVETRQHPFRVVYDKQTEFFDKLVLILDDLNSYITSINVWIGETSSDAHSKAKEAAENNAAVGEFYDLIQRYYMYLPGKLLNEANKLHSECMFLSTNYKEDKTFECIDLLFSFQNTIREFVGVDKLSEDFQKAFVRKHKKGHS